MKNPLKSLFVAGALFGAVLSANAASAHDADALFERLQQTGAETTYTQGINALSGGAYGYGGRGYGGRGYGRGYYGGRGFGRGYGHGPRHFGHRGYYGGRGYGRGLGLGYRRW